MSSRRDLISCGMCSTTRMCDASPLYLGFRFPVVRSTPSLPCGSQRVLEAATILRCGTASGRRSSITPSRMEGLKSFRRPRGAPRLASSLSEPVTMLTEPRVHGPPYQRIVVGYQYAAHGGLPPLYFPQNPATGFVVVGCLQFRQANQYVALISAANRKAVCPLLCIGTAGVSLGDWVDLHMVINWLSSSRELRVPYTLPV